MSHAGTRLLADLAGATTVSPGSRPRRYPGCAGPVHAMTPGRGPVDLAVAIADGAETISDIAAPADHPALFGRVASDSACWRLRIDRT